MGKFMKKVVTGAVVLAFTGGMTGCTTMGADGKEHSDLGKSAGMGAGIGAVAGYMIGGAKGAVLGAALGGGAGLLVGLDAQKKELEDAKVAAADLQKNMPYLKPVVYTQNFQDKAGQKGQGLKSVDMELPIKEMTDRKGHLNDKGEVAMLKIQAVADRLDGSMDIIVPRNLAPATYKALVHAAPRAKMIVADGNTSTVTARINGKPLDASSGVRTLNA